MSVSPIYFITDCPILKIFCSALKRKHYFVTHSKQIKVVFHNPKRRKLCQFHLLHHRLLYLLMLAPISLDLQQIIIPPFGEILLYNMIPHLRWWKDLNIATNLPFARDRLVELYFWTLGVYFEPQFSFGRRLMTKVISMMSIIDDIYDLYGTFEELQLFMDAIERWDITCMDFLPKYMKFCYKALLDVFKEIEQEMDKEGRAFCAIYAKKEMKRLVQAYFAEAKWLNRNYTPTMEEYMDVAQVSSGYHMVTTMAFVGMGCIVTENSFQWLTNGPKIIDAATKICRLMDDIVSNEFEQKRGHVASALECYMKQHGVTKQEAIDELYKQVTSAWKDINKEYLNPTKVPRTLVTIILNLSRVMDVLYKDEDGYTHSDGSTKNDITALLLNSWPV
ncbi:hypothetical protein VNO77_37306 [Canavalia gladiata]|uniref:Terpene synthase metal-binding domain-containing protein n=1 Tax=Canavalia gladiata TaxID=3824 RepID=A0AAN9PX22_CANGL